METEKIDLKIKTIDVWGFLDDCSRKSDLNRYGDGCTEQKCGLSSTSGVELIEYGYSVAIDDCSSWLSKLDDNHSPHPDDDSSCRNYADLDLSGDEMSLYPTMFKERTFPIAGDQFKSLNLVGLVAFGYHKFINEYQVFLNQLKEEVLKARTE